MKLKLPALPAFALGLLLVLTTACEFDPLSEDYEISSAQYFFQAQQEIQFVLMAILGEQQLYDPYYKGITSNELCLCAEVSASRVDSARQVDVLFKSDCACYDQAIRRGRLRVLEKSSWNLADGQVQVLPEEYAFIDAHGDTGYVSFSLVLQKQAVNGGLPRIVAQFKEALLEKDGQILRWTANFVVHPQGESPQDGYRVLGALNGTFNEAEPFNVGIEKPLLIRPSCPQILEGTLSITPEGRRTRKVDFGSGTCDNQAEVEIAGFSRSILF